MKTALLLLAAIAATTASAVEVCSEFGYQIAVKNVPKTGVSDQCQRAVFFQLCDKCGRDIGCYMSNGPKVAPKTPACQHRSRALRSNACNERVFKAAVAKAPKTGVSLGCQRSVFNALCGRCGHDTKCYWKHGPSVAKKSPLCRPRRLTSYEMDEGEESAGGFGRFCATAACLFIDNLSPPREQYIPPPPMPTPIHRPYDEMDEGEESAGGFGRFCATAACLFIDNLSPPREQYIPPPPPPTPIHRPYV